MKKEYIAALVSIYDYLKLVDNGQEQSDCITEFQKMNDGSLVNMFFRKLRAYKIDLSKVEGLEHFKKYYENNGRTA